jgi:hypothetical protein
MTDLSDFKLEIVAAKVNLFAEPVLWIRDVYPGSRILIFIYPGSNTTTKEGEKFVILHFLVATKFHKFVNYLISE